MPSPAAIGGAQNKPALSADIATVGGPQPTSLSSLYAGGQKPWQPAYGMAGYGQGLEMNPYQGGPTTSNGGPGSYNPAQYKPAMVGGGMQQGYGGRPQMGAFGKPSIGYGGGYNQTPQRAARW